MTAKPCKGELVHWCPVIDEKKIKDILVTTYDGEWIIRDEFEDTSITDISFCPFCGVGLTPKRVQPEIKEAQEVADNFNFDEIKQIEF